MNKFTRYIERYFSCKVRIRCEKFIFTLFSANIIRTIRLKKFNKENISNTSRMLSNLNVEHTNLCDFSIDSNRLFPK
jgi:hypothetical protein